MDSLRAAIQAVGDPVGSIVRAFCLPKEFGKGFRLASEGAGMPSAAADLPQELEVADWAGATVTKQLPASNTMGFLFANPCRAFVYYLPNTAAAVSRYDGQAAYGLGTETFYLPNAACITRLQPKGAIPSELDTLAAHGPYMPAGYDQAGNSYLWADNFSGEGTVEVNLQTPATLDATVVQFVFWNGRNESPWGAAISSTAGQTLFSVPAPAGGAYMSARVMNWEPAGGTCTLNVNTTGAIWAHRTVTNFDSIAPIANGIRVNSAAVKLQNSASIDNKNGKIISATVSKAISWTSIASGYNAVAQLQNYRDRTADNGYYGFLVPDDDNDVSDFYDDICTTALVTDPTFNCGYPLSDRRPYKVIACDVPVAAGRAFTWDVIHTIEYQTNKKLVEQGFSPYTEDQIAAAIIVLRSMESDYENPIHIGSILATIGKYLPRAATFASGVLRLMGGKEVTGIAQFLDDNASGIAGVGNSLQAFKKKKKN